MAITRTQIAKQLLAQGGRIGLKPGGPPGGGATSMGSGRDYSAPDKSKGPAGGQTMTGGGGFSDKERQQRRDLRDEVQRFENEKIEERLEKFRRLGSDRRKIESFASKFSPIAMFASKFGPLNTRDFFTENYLSSKNAPMTKEQFANLTNEEQEELFDNYMDARMSGEIDAYGNRIERGDRGDPNILLPQGIMTQAPSITELKPEEEDEGLRLAFRANGGRIGFFSAGLGPKFDIFNPIDSMKAIQRFKLGLKPEDIAIAKKIEEEKEDEKNLFTSGVDQSTVNTLLNPDAAANFQKITTETSDLLKADTDLMKTLADIGKAEGGRIGLMEGGMPYEGGIMDLESARQMYGLGKLVKKVTRTVKKIAKSPIGKAALIYAGTGALGNLAGGSGLGGMFKGFTSPAKFLGGASNIFKAGGLKNIFLGAEGVPQLGIKGSSGILGFGGKLSPFKAIVGASALAGLLTPAQEEEAQALSTGEGIDIEAARRMILQAGTSGDKRALVFRADGGRIEYQEGSKEPVAKKTMPLLDMDGKEMDLREDGGFVPIGRMEKADDVPARLSKNEFVLCIT